MRVYVGLLYILVAGRLSSFVYLLAAGCWLAWLLFVCGLCCFVMEEKNMLPWLLGRSSLAFFFFTAKKNNAKKKQWGYFPKPRGTRGSLPMARARYSHTLII